MPKHSRYSSTFTAKVNVSERKDGERRYRINLPKQLGDSEKEITGVFIYRPEQEYIILDTRPDWEYFIQQEESSKRSFET